MSHPRSGKPVATQLSATQALADGNPASVSEATRRKARLIRTIEGEIIPRLLISLSGSLATVREGHHWQGSSTVDRQDLGSIALAARRLGESWKREECNFDQLLAGLMRLEAAIREIDTRSIDPGS